MLMRYEFDALPLGARYPWNDTIQAQLRAIIRTVGRVGILERVAMEFSDYVSDRWALADSETELAEIDAVETLADAIGGAVEKFEDATESA